MIPIESFLEHYGVKGMRWGQRRKRGPDGRVKSTEAKRAEQILTKAKKKGKSSLTNKELGDLNKRLQLEQQYSKLVNNDPKAKLAIKAGAAFVTGIGLNVARETIKNQASAKVGEALAKKTKQKATGG